MGFDGRYGIAPADPNPARFGVTHLRLLEATRELTQDVSISLSAKPDPGRRRSKSPVSVGACAPGGARTTRPYNSRRLLDIPHNGGLEPSTN
jgi:hypothetical protein